MMHPNEEVDASSEVSGDSQWIELGCGFLDAQARVPVLLEFARVSGGVLHKGMPDFAAPVEKLIDELKHLPGIGLKTAQRLAFHLLRAAPEDALALADAIRDAQEKIRECSTCGNITDNDPCLYCAGASRNKRTICVV